MPGIEFPIDLQWLMELIFGGATPSWVGPVVGYCFMLLVLLWIVNGIISLVGNAARVWTEHLQPIFYSPARRRRVERRRRFASHLEHELRRLNDLEEWSDYRYAELEAEVEAEGRRRMSWLRSLLPLGSGLRREPSLSRAIERSKERLILLEGEPGVGKSVALRHAALSMLRHAAKARSRGVVIPIYVNLRELVRGDREAIDASLIRAFVLQYLQRVHRRDVEEFLEQEFDKGLDEGTWLFLFDSFDELPEILSSTEADAIIECYAEAISDFLHGMNQCRGIIASRHFRGPSQLAWPRFRILPLSKDRRLELIGKAHLEPELERALLGDLQMAAEEIRLMAGNPMFLGLLCEHVKVNGALPDSTHSAFETYVGERLTRDAGRVKRRYGLTPIDLRATAQTVAFAMTATRGLGLAPSRQALREALLALGLPADEGLGKALDALEYIRLARSERVVGASESELFAFSHRRFQEYFATCVVLSEPALVQPEELLTNGRWRETVVAMCQTQPGEALSPVIDAARELLNKMVIQTPGLVGDLSEYIGDAQESRGETESRPLESNLRSFPWPSGALHLLSILQDGFRSRLHELPHDVRREAGRLVLSASVQGIIPDRKYALQVAGAAPQDVLSTILSAVFGQKSRILRDAAYRQVARLDQIPEDVAREIRTKEVAWIGTGKLWLERKTKEAYLARLDSSAGLLRYFRFVVASAPVDLIVHAAMAWLTVRLHVTGTIGGMPLTLLLVSLGVSLLSTYLDWWPFRVVYVLRILVLWLGCLTLLLALIDLRFDMTRLEANRALIAVYGYLLSWHPSAVFLNAETAKFVHPLCWPFFPLLYASRVICYNLVGPGVSWRRMASKVRALLVAAVFGTVAYLLVKLGESSALLSVLLLLLLSLPALLDSLGRISRVVCWARNSARDSARYRRWSLASPTDITPQELCQLLEGFQTTGFRARLIKRVRERNLLSPSRDNVAEVRNMIMEIENARRETRPDLPSWISGLSRIPWNPFTELVSTWLYALWDAARTLRQRSPRLDQECLDELTEFLEQGERSRRYGA